MRKEADVVNVRLENIKLKNKLRKKEQQLKSKVLECPKNCYICTCIPVLKYFRWNILCYECLQWRSSCVSEKSDFESVFFFLQFKRFFCICAKFQTMYNKTVNAVIFLYLRFRKVRLNCVASKSCMITMYRSLVHSVGWDNSCGKLFEAGKCIRNASILGILRVMPRLTVHDKYLNYRENIATKIIKESISHSNSRTWQLLSKCQFVKNCFISISGRACRRFALNWLRTIENWKPNIQWENRRKKWGM